MDSNDIKQSFAGWSHIGLPDDAKSVILANLKHAVKPEVDLREKRTHTLAPTGRFAVQAIFALTGLVICAIVLALTFRTTPNTTTSHKIKQAPMYPAFSPPHGLVQAFRTSGDNGQLFIAGYGARGSFAPPTDTTYFTKASRAYVVVTRPNGIRAIVAMVVSPKTHPQMNTIDVPLWFSSGDVWYAAVGSEQDDGDHVTLYRFAPAANSLGWTVEATFRHVYSSFQLLYASGSNLLIRSAAIGTRPEILGSFTSTGVEWHPVTANYPATSHHLHTFVVTLKESVTQGAHGDVVTLAGSPTPLHVRVGDTVVIRITGDHSVAVTPLFYADQGDPGDGSFGTRLPSPYTDAMLYRIDVAAKHGLITFNPWNGTAAHGVQRIVVVSTK